MINTKDVKIQQKSLNRYLTPGTYQVKVNKITPVQSKTGSWQLRFEMETPPITDEGFTPAEGYSGQVGTVRSLYLSNPDMERAVAELIALLGFKTGTKEQLDAIPEGLEIEAYAKAVEDIVKDKYVYCTINGREYINTQNGKKNTELNFPKFKAFCTIEEYEANPEKAIAKPFIKALPTEPVGEAKPTEGLY